MVELLIRYGEDGQRTCDAYVVAVAGECRKQSRHAMLVDTGDQVDLEVERSF